MVCRAFSLISFLCKSLHRTNTLLARPPICERFKTKRKSFRYVVVAATLAPVPAITCFTSIIMSSVPSRGEQTEGSFVFRVLPLEPPSFPICLIHAPLSLSSYPPFPLIFSRGELHLSESALLQEHLRSSGAPMEGDFGAGTLPLFSSCTSADAGMCHVVFCKS